MNLIITVSADGLAPSQVIGHQQVQCWLQGKTSFLYSSFWYIFFNQLVLIKRTLWSQEFIYIEYYFIETTIAITYSSIFVTHEIITGEGCDI